MKLKQLEKISFMTFFPMEIFFVSFWILNIVCPHRIQMSHSFYKKTIAKFELNHTKKNLGECSSTLEFFFKICAHFYFFQLILYLLL